MADDINDSVGVITRDDSQRAMTDKGLEFKLHQLTKVRRGKLGQVTAQEDETERLLSREILPAVNDVREALKVYKKLYEEFQGCNYAVLLCIKDEEEKEADQQLWFQPMSERCLQFINRVNTWIEIQTCDQEITPMDSASRVSKTSRVSNTSKVSNTTRVSTASSERVKEEANRAALMARAASLKEKQALELKEAEIKAAKERLEIETAIAVSTAKVKVYEECEGVKSQVSETRLTVMPRRDLLKMNNENGHGNVKHTPGKPTEIERSAYWRNPGDPSTAAGAIPRTHRTPLQGPSQRQDGVSLQETRPSELYQVMQKQADITEMLVKNQQLARLPQRDVPVFHGDPLEYRSFMRAFMHAIDTRADSNSDKLYFLEQYTRGESRDLVRSCQHMPEHRGYERALQLLQDKYGNELQIASTLIEKASKWPQIKAEDGKALSAFSVFLVSCRNAMEDVDYMEEMDNPATMRVIISKLPFKIRERWRIHAYDIQERRCNRARFTELVAFVERQAKIMSDPLFGDLETAVSDKVMKKPQQGNKLKKDIRHGSSFAIKVNQGSEMDKRSRVSKNQSDLSFNCAFTRPCMFCGKLHTLQECYKIREETHKDRVDYLKKNGLCFGCLLKGHMSRDCKKKMVCEVCSLKHPSLLHFSSYEEEKPPAEVNTGSTAKGPAGLSEEKETSACTGAGGSCVLAIVPVRVKSCKSDKAVEVYAFIDPGSSASFCTEALARQLKVQGRRTELTLRTINSKSREESYVLTELEVSSLADNNFIALSKVFTQKSIPVSRENIPLQKEVEKWPYLREVRLPHIEAEVELLIGTKEYTILEPWKVIPSEDNGPYAVKTALGWILNGPLRETDTAANDVQPCAIVNRIAIDNVEQLLVRQYNHDFPERHCDDKAGMSQEDHHFMESVSSSTRLTDGHYSISLPTKKSCVQMPNNRSAVLQRALSLQRKLKRNPALHEEYTAFMSDMLSKGYAVEVPTTQLNRKDGKQWYIPHHGVYHPQKKKLRVVFDCAASYQGVSLNSELLQGPDLTNSLIGVLTRFRQESIAFTADIEAMYHQVCVPDDDADLQRFLWWPAGDLNRDIAEYRMMVHIFGATSSPSCANYALRRTAEENRSKSSPEAVSTVLENFYVDDCLKSVATETQGMELYTDLTELCSGGGFHLTKWTSNSRALLSFIPEHERAKDVRDLNLNHDLLPMERALGVLWCPESDAFKFRINIKERPVTRRGILSVTSSIYDPLGFLSPGTLPAKMILQQLCREGLAWDDEIPEQLNHKWNKWLQELCQLSEVTVPRCVRPLDFGPVATAQLHHFSDGSESGYGTASYLRMTSNDGRVHCTLMMGKSRVAPLKQTTIPRIELTAAMVAAKTDKMLRTELQMNLLESTFWTDSTTVLKYIENENLRFKTFVANRIAVIRELTNPQQWRYVGTAINPADCASRGLAPSKLMKSLSWFHGPAFLKTPERQWPERPDKERIDKDDSEVRHATMVHLTNAAENVHTLNKLINHYSSWHRVKRAVAWMIKLKDLLLRRCEKRKETYAKQKEQDYESMQTTLTLKDLVQAETEIIKFCQSQQFQEEITMLKKGKCVTKTSHLRKLDPVMQDGVLRVGGRLAAAGMPEHVKHPVIIPKGSHITTLILQDIHEKIGHCGRLYMLSRLRQKYWIPSANSEVRKFLSRCVICRKTRGKPLEQKMADLPEDRLLPDEPPFSNVGVDYFGPFNVKHGRSTVKRYGVLFTCLTTRAVHIEIAHTLDTDSCLNAIRRFVCRRGQVSVMRSDNGTNLVAAERELREAIQEWNQSKILDCLMQKGIQWVFNPPAGSHFGGIWERQIRTVRKVLRSILKEQLVNDEGLLTLMCEVESVLNDRPLTTVTDDPTDLEPLTPNHLLLMKKKPGLPPGLFRKEDSYSRRRWKQVQYLADLFWKRWVREYLPMLQERQRWTQVRRNVTVGDIVMVVDESAPRSSWMLGRVLRVIPDAKGLVRRVIIKTKTNTLERPIDKLCLICENVM